MRRTGDGSFSFDGKVAVVTGAASGIGAAAVAALRAAGATVAACDLDSAVPTHRGQRNFELDVADPVAVATTIARIAVELGGIDLLISNAGTATRASIATMPVADWQRVIGVNLSAAFYLTKAVAPVMRARGGGAIVVVGSTAAKTIGYLSGVHYTASKAGLLAFARHAAFELGRDRIRVNTILPGPMENSMRVPHARAKTPESIADTGASLPLGEMVKPADVALAALYLCSPASAMLTGNELYVDSGWLTGFGFDIRQYFELRVE